ncbi:MAG: T9SS type A sorting domain-containing protein [Ignavibacteriaceae bacterium]|nr:T9SS type A sorting domain-containing protein [Ignavibacteriaceae bacterium]
MNKNYNSIILIVISLIIGFALFNQQPIEKEKDEFPSDWFFMQRAYPLGEVPLEKYYEAIEQTKQIKSFNKSSSANPWVLRGPTNIGGRISDIEMSPTSFDTIYAGIASGGVFKSVDQGLGWFPIFDETYTMSIGDLVVDPTNPNIIYVGTGEVNGGGGSVTYGGNGVYKSTDAGTTWNNIGLAATEYISRIIIDPKNPQRIFLGAMGKLFSKNSERGLYRSTDGGTTWENKLFISDSTGCIDVAVNPLNPDTIYAAMWERIRRPDRRSYGGPTCGLYRSTDGGDTWIELTNGIPHNSPSVGRIGISISASSPNILYAIYADNIGYFAGVYKSTNNGDSWVRTSDGALSSLFSSFGWWFGNIRVDPSNPNNVFVMGLDVYKTSNGGSSWSYSSGSMHVDQHGMYIHPANPNFIVAGNDGGVYKSLNAGSSWSFITTMPITQFYTCEIDHQFPNRAYGGTQDNGTNRTMTGNLNDWQQICGGDGFYVLVDPSNNNFVYAEYQYGAFARSTNGGSSFNYGLNGVNSSDRFNWCTPYIIDPSNPATLYLGTHRIYKSTNRAVSWTPISPDLTNGPPGGNLVYGTITTIASAHSDPNVIYAGTDDANVWVTTNSGTNWTKISTSLPSRWVTRVAVDPNDAMTAYVTLSGYRYDEYLPHVFRTTDAGINWSDISSNLPDAPVNDIIVDPDSASRLYVGTDVGVFVTENLGISWSYLGENLPNAPITDLVLHNPTRTLIAATYGRSMYSVDLTLVTDIEKNNDGLIDFVLFQNYPNPFNPSTKIKFTIPSVTLRQAQSDNWVTLKVYDVLGNEIATLVNEEKQPGTHEVEFNSTSHSGEVRNLSSGIYFYQLKAGNYIETKKMILMK